MSIHLERRSFRFTLVSIQIICSFSFFSYFQSRSCIFDLKFNPSHSLQVLPKKSHVFLLTASKLKEKQPELMRKNEFVDVVAKKSSVSKQDAERIIKLSFEIIADAVSSNKKVSFPGLGAFEARKRKAREGKNLQNGETIVIEEKSVPVFIAAQAFKTAVKATAKNSSAVQTDTFKDSTSFEAPPVLELPALAKQISEPKKTQDEKVKATANNSFIVQTDTFKDSTSFEAPPVLELPAPAKQISEPKKTQANSNTGSSPPVAVLPKPESSSPASMTAISIKDSTTAEKKPLSAEAARQAQTEAAKVLAEATETLLKVKTEPQRLLGEEPLSAEEAAKVLAEASETLLKDETEPQRMPGGEASQPSNMLVDGISLAMKITFSVASQVLDKIPTHGSPSKSLQASDILTAPVPSGKQVLESQTDLQANGRQSSGDAAEVQKPKTSKSIATELITSSKEKSNANLKGLKPAVSAKDTSTLSVPSTKADTQKPYKVSPSLKKLLPESSVNLLEKRFSMYVNKGINAKGFADAIEQLAGTNKNQTRKSIAKELVTSWKEKSNANLQGLELAVSAKGTSTLSIPTTKADTLKPYKVSPSLKKLLPESSINLLEKRFLLYVNKGINAKGFADAIEQLAGTNKNQVQQDILKCLKGVKKEQLSVIIAASNKKRRIF